MAVDLEVAMVVDHQHAAARAVEVAVREVERWIGRRRRRRVPVPRPTVGAVGAEVARVHVIRPGAAVLAHAVVGVGTALPWSGAGIGGWLGYNKK